MSHIIPSVGVVIATTGRKALITETLISLLGRDSLPACIVISGAKEGDLPDIESFESEVNLILTLSPEKGAATQRNHGLTQLPKDIDFVSFLDDDVEMHNSYFAEVRHVFESSPELVAFSGMVMVNGDIEPQQARQRLDAHVIPKGMPSFGYLRNKWPGLYGCAMNMRREIIDRVKFDDNLPLYSLGEDIEVGFRLSQYGAVGGSARCPLVHLATKTGRIAEVGVGYAQIVNYLYFVNKDIGYPRLRCYFERMMQIPFANLVYTFFPQLDSYRAVDRKGRLRGNMIAFQDLIIGKAHPSRLIDVVATTKRP